MRRGFTLIELLVVVVISMMLAGVGVVSITRYLAREQVVSAGNEILSAVQLARNYAVTDQPVSFTHQLDFVAVTLTAGGQLAVWPANLASGTGPSYLSENIGSDKVALTPINYGDLFFSVPEGKLLKSDKVTPVASNYVETVSVSSNQGISQTMAVTVDAEGKIW